MGVRAIRRFTPFVDDNLWRSLVRITHAEIDNVFSRRPGLLFQITDDVENIRGEALNALKLVFHALVTLDAPNCGTGSLKKVGNSKGAAPRCQREGRWFGRIAAS